MCENVWVGAGASLWQLALASSSSCAGISLSHTHNTLTHSVSLSFLFFCSFVLYAYVCVCVCLHVDFWSILCVLSIQCKWLCLSCACVLRALCQLGLAGLLVSLSLCLSISLSLSLSFSLSLSSFTLCMNPFVRGCFSVSQLVLSERLLCGTCIFSGEYGEM